MAAYEGPAEVRRRVLPPALETLTAWTMACEEDPRFFHDAMNRVLADALRSQDPRRGLTELMFGMTSLSGILLEELATSSGRSPSDLLGELNDPQHRWPTVCPDSRVPRIVPMSDLPTPNPAGCTHAPSFRLAPQPGPDRPRPPAARADPRST